MDGRFVPLINNRAVRTALGLVFAAASPILANALLGRLETPPAAVATFVGFIWLPSVWLTAKYVHKYPQRYTTYLLASHLKATAIMLVLGGAIRITLGATAAPFDELLLCVALVAVVDFLASMPRRAQRPEERFQHGNGDPAGMEREVAADGGEREVELAPVDGHTLVGRLEEKCDPLVRSFLGAHLPDNAGARNEYVLLDDIPEMGGEELPDKEAVLLVACTRLNDVRRLNLFLKHCAGRIAMGGYLAATYLPLEATYERLRQRYSGIAYRLAYLLHFVWYRAIPKIPLVDKLYFTPLFSWIDRLFLRRTRLRTRVLSTAEVWGRLAYYGMEVVAESAGECAERMILARRVALQAHDRTPSFYAIVALEKVGLDGVPIRLHKIRSMYPFSEFLQKKVLESHGLSPTGKFKDDPRLTEYAKLIRSNWLDEIPGIYDWLRGDVKLVGMRATSPHFLSLYPKELYDLYVRVKPGLVPPIFDESTEGFEAIVETELAYLKQYMKSPIKTDIQYFWYTFRDIFLRKVRSH